MYKDALNKGFLIRICYIRLMIIDCPSCKKQFEVDSDLIPDKGKLLQCGSCNHTWFFNKQEKSNNENEFVTTKKTNENKKTLPKVTSKINDVIDKDTSDLFNYNNKGSELVKYEPKFNFSVGKILNYIIVLIISFVAVIIVLDTFKGPLNIFFPNIELILYNLFETLKDLVLFIKDLK